MEVTDFVRRYPPAVQKYLHDLDQALAAIDELAAARLAAMPSAFLSATSIMLIQRQRQAEADPILNEKLRIYEMYGGPFSLAGVQPLGGMMLL